MCYCTWNQTSLKLKSLELTLDSTVHKTHRDRINRQTQDIMQRLSPHHLVSSQCVVASLNTQGHGTCFIPQSVDTVNWSVWTVEIQNLTCKKQSVIIHVDKEQTHSTPYHQSRTSNIGNIQQCEKGGRTHQVMALQLSHMRSDWYTHLHHTTYTRNEWGTGLMVERESIRCRTCTESSYDCRSVAVWWSRIHACKPIYHG